MHPQCHVRILFIRLHSTLLDACAVSPVLAVCMLIHHIVCDLCVVLACRRVHEVRAVPRGGAAEAEGGRPRGHPARDRRHQLQDTGGFAVASVLPCCTHPQLCCENLNGLAACIMPHPAAARFGARVAGLPSAVCGRHRGDTERGARADRRQDRGVAGGGQGRDRAGRALHRRGAFPWST